MLKGLWESRKKRRNSVAQRIQQLRKRSETKFLKDWSLIGIVIGKVDEFRVEMEDIGALSKLRVWHDNRGVASDWHLASISLRSLVTGDRYAGYQLEPALSDIVKTPHVFV